VTKLAVTCYGAEFLTQMGLDIARSPLAWTTPGVVPVLLRLFVRSVHIIETTRILRGEDQPLKKRSIRW